MTKCDMFGEGRITYGYRNFIGNLEVRDHVGYLDVDVTNINMLLRVTGYDIVPGRFRGLFF